MKKALKVVALILTLTLITGSALGEGLKVGIITQKENGAFLDMRQGIMNGLAAAGITEDSDEIVYQCAQGDATTLSTICNSMDGYDLVFTIATPATQQFVNMGSETPLFFCAVSAPVAAGVLSDMAAPDKNATGASNAIPVSDIFALAETLTPGIEKWGMIYSTGETNAVNTVEACIAYLEEAGIPYTASTINDSSEVATVTEALAADGCTAIFVPNDSNVQAGVSALTDICREYGIPTYAASATTVASGCLATVAIDDVGIGEKTAALAVEYLNGTALTDIPAIVVSADYVSINEETAAALQLDLGEAETLTVGESEYAINRM